MYVLYPVAALAGPAAVSLLESQVFAGRLDLRERDRPFAFDRYPAFFTFYGYFFALTQRKRLCGRVFQNGGQFRSVFQHRLDFPADQLAVLPQHRERLTYAGRHDR